VKSLFAAIGILFIFVHVDLHAGDVIDFRTRAQRAKCESILTNATTSGSGSRGYFSHTQPLVSSNLQDFLSNPDTSLPDRIIPIEIGFFKDERILVDRPNKEVGYDLNVGTLSVRHYLLGQVRPSQDEVISLKELLISMGAVFPAENENRYDQSDRFVIEAPVRIIRQIIELRHPALGLVQLGWYWERGFLRSDGTYLN
jgi:hypothetical protein